MTLKNKIIDYLKVRGISKSKFYSETGLSNGFLDSGKSITVDSLKIIISAFPELNLNYLVLDDIDKPYNKESLNDPQSIYNKPGCVSCREKQREIDRLQDTISLLLEESKKDRELIRSLVTAKDESLNKQANSA